MIILLLHFDHLGVSSAGKNQTFVPSSGFNFGCNSARVYRFCISFIGYDGLKNQVNRLSPGARVAVNVRELPRMKRHNGAMALRQRGDSCRRRSRTFYVPSLPQTPQRCLDISNIVCRKFEKPSTLLSKNKKTIKQWRFSSKCHNVLMIIIILLYYAK